MISNLSFDRGQPLSTYAPKGRGTPKCVRIKGGYVDLLLYYGPKSVHGGGGWKSRKFGARTEKGALRVQPINTLGQLPSEHGPIYRYFFEFQIRNIYPLGPMRRSELKLSLKRVCLWEVSFMVNFSVWQGCLWVLSSFANKPASQRHTVMPGYRSYFEFLQIADSLKLKVT